MKITRHNYEEWFILYLDNELCSEDRREVELFVKENPDLQSEFDLLLQSRLIADTSLVFPGKDQLMKTNGAVTVNKENYEEWLLSYIDNELTAEEKSSVEQFVDAHPAIKTELDLLKRTKLQPGNLVFEDKQLLYRSEEKVRVIGINWRRIAIAASLVLAVGTTALLIFNSNDKPGVVVDNNEKKPIPVQQNTREMNDHQKPSGTKLATNSNQTTTEKTEENIPVAIKEKHKKTTPAFEKAVNNKIIHEEELAVAPKEQKRSNELPEPVYNPNLNKPVPQDNPIAMTEIPETTQLTIPKETNAQTTVTPEPTEALYTANQPGKKNKLRGFFRKITRTFEKNTNIKATDDQDRLLLGGLAIKL